MIRWITLVGLLIVPGITGTAVFGYYALQDWAALRGAWAHFESVAASGSDMRALAAAEAVQNAHRVNLFAEGVWALLSALIAAVGVHGVCTGSRGGVTG